MCTLDVVRAMGHSHIDLVVDNIGTLAQVGWGHAAIVLPAWQRILRRIAQHIRWQGVTMSLRYVESGLNLLTA